MSRRSTYSFLAVAMALFLSAYVVAGPAEDEKTPKPAAKSVEEFNERITELEARVAALESIEERVAEIERRSMQTIIRSHPVPPSINEPIPPDWKEQEFNGLRYYLVPLNEQNAQPTTKLAPSKAPPGPGQPVR